MFACLLLMAGPALAVMRNTVFLQETGNGAVVSVRLEERQDDILSLGLSLQISFPDGDGSQAGVSFAFDSAVHSKIMEYRYNEAKGILSLYISGQENLFTNEELTLGTVAVSIAEGSTVTARISVIEDSLQLINAAYDNENNEGVSAPEAPEFTVGGETQGGEETLPPPETDGPEPGNTEPNPGNNSQNPGNNGPGPGGSAQNPAGNENPEGEPPESASASEKPTREPMTTTAASEPAKSETAQGTGSSEWPEHTQEGEETPTQGQQMPTSAAADDSQTMQVGIFGGGDGFRGILFGVLGLAGAAGLFALAIWANRSRRARQRRLRHQRRRHGRETSVHHKGTGEDPKAPAAREAARHRREAVKQQETIKHHRPLSGPEAAKRRAAAREAAHMHMEQHKREAADLQHSRGKAEEPQGPRRRS